MASTVLYKPGYPSVSVPFKNEASVGDDGFVSVAAQFLINEAQRGVFKVNSSMSASSFSSLASQPLQQDKVFIESVSLEKNSGLWIANVALVGATNPPVVKYTEEVAPRSFNKSKNNEDGSVSVFSFDYLASTTTATCTFIDGDKLSFGPKTPQIVAVWNKNGSGVILRYDLYGNPIIVEYPETANLELVATPVLLTSKTAATTARLTRVTVTKQIVYQ